MPQGGVLVRCSTCTLVSSNPASISKKVLSQPYRVKHGKRRPRGPRGPVSYCLPGVCLFHLDQILLWDAVNLCQLLQTVNFDHRCQELNSSNWWVSPVILAAERSVKGLGSPFLPQLRLQPFIHQPASLSRQSAQKISPAQW